MIPVCLHCSGQVFRGQCLQCSREVNPFAPISLYDRLTSPMLPGRIMAGHVRHTRPLPMAEDRVPFTVTASPRKVRR